LKNFCFHNFVFPGCDIRPARLSCSRQTDVLLFSKAEFPLETRHDSARYFLDSRRSFRSKARQVSKADEHGRDEEETPPQWRPINRIS
jgi:hypothetical protein